MSSVDDDVHRAQVNLVLHYEAVPRLALYLRARLPAIAEIHTVNRDGFDIF